MLRQLLLRIPVPWVFVLAYLLGVPLDFALPLRHSSGLRQADLIAAGSVLFMAGCVIAGWSWILFQRAGTTRVPGEKSSAFIAWGPFRISRNPMYVGLTLAYLGEAAMLRQIWPPVLLPLVLAYLNSVVIPLEETRLQEVFGNSYEAYCRRIRRWF